MTSDQIVSSIRSFISDNFVLGREAHFLSESDSLIEMGVIDSAGVLSLVVFLEETFDIKVADDEVIPENLDSIGHLRAFVEMKLRDRVEGD